MMPTRRFLILGCLVLPLMGLELGLRALRAPSASIRLINGGEEPMEDVRISSGSSERWLARIEAGGSSRVSLSGKGKAPLRVSYRQRGNALSGFEVGRFDPSALESEGATMVITVRKGEYERYQEDEEATPLGRMASRAKQWLEESL